MLDAARFPGRPESRANVRGFLHVCCIGGYREVTWEIVHALLESRLYDRSTVIEVGILGAPADQRVVEDILAPFGRFHIAFRSTDIGQYEFPTLGLLQDACRIWDGPVYYLHTKGVSAPANQYARYWRKLMLDHIVTGHRDCLTELGTSDTVGTIWAGDHYSGNFWWARAAHIRRLPDVRELQRNPRAISPKEQVDGQPAAGRGMGPDWNTRLQCEHWLHMEPARVGAVAARRGLHLYRELCWTVTVEQIVDDLLRAVGGDRSCVLTDDDPDPTGGGYDVILVDRRRDPGHVVDVVERCLPRLSSRGAIVVRHTNPPSAWHQRPAAEFTSDAEWTGQVWRSVIEFRVRNPDIEVFTIDTDWGCTVIRPGRRARHRPDVTGGAEVDWATFAVNRRDLLNLVDVGWFRRYLYAEPYLTGAVRPPTGTELVNVVLAAGGLDSYLRVGGGAGEDPTAIIAPIRHRIDPDAAAGQPGLGSYDVVCTDPGHLEDALSRLSERGSLVVRGRTPAGFVAAHPEYHCCTVDLDTSYTIVNRRTGTAPDPQDDLLALFGRAPADTAAGGPAELPQLPYAGNRELLHAAVELDPDDLRAVMFLGDAYFAARDFAAARTWYSRALELRDWWWSGFDEGIYVAMFRTAESMAALGEPWPEVRDAYLRAWEFRPDRLAPLYAVAVRYRLDHRYQLGYLYARAAADITPPGTDDPEVTADPYHWRIRDELAVCASWTGRRAEAFGLWRELLRRKDLPARDHARISDNRDSCVPTMIEAASPYPDGVVRALVAGGGGTAVTVSVILGPLLGPAERALNSFLHCCLDVTRAGRFLALDAGLSPADRASLQQRYGFLEFAPAGAAGAATLAGIRALVDTPLWLHLGSGWRFFAPDHLIARLQAALAADPQVCGVEVNRREPDPGAAEPAGELPAGPAMYDTARLDQAARGAAGGAAGRATATLGEVVCLQQTLVTVIGRGNSGTRAIARTLMRSGFFMGKPIKQDSADLVPAEQMYEACRIISRYIPWRGGLDWDFGPVQTMPIPAEFTALIEGYLHSVLSCPDARAGWKLPETTLCYPWIRRLFPDIRYVFWVRNPLDAITNHHFTDDLRDFGIDYPPTDDPYLRRAISWKYQDDLVAATPRPRHQITVRFEDFVRHQERELGRLQEFLGVDLARIPVRDDPIDRHLRIPGIPSPDFLTPAMRRYGYRTGAPRPT